MSPRRIDEYWRHRVRVLTESEPNLSAPAMALRLEKEAENLGRSDSPSERWIRKEQADFRPALPAERAAYRQFAWPESMGTPDLPWEASATALELLRLFRPYETGQRPTIRLVVWFWRITQAVPELRELADLRRSLAGWLTAAELAKDMAQGPAVEAYLLYRAWTPEGAVARAEAEQKGQVPPFPELLGQALQPGHLLDLLAALIGPETAEDVRRLVKTMHRIDAEREAIERQRQAQKENPS